MGKYESQKAAVFMLLDEREAMMSSGLPEDTRCLPANSFAVQRNQAETPTVLFGFAGDGLLMGVTLRF